MWLMLSDAFFSLVAKDCGRDEILVRARRAGDIEKIFAGAKVTKTAHADYLFRATIKRDEVAIVLAREVQRITYPNFKDSVEDEALHNAYMKTWNAMAALQPGGPRALKTDHPPFGPMLSRLFDTDAERPPRKRRYSRRRSLKKGK